MKSIGGREQTEEFSRLFLIPGVHHCAGGPGLTDFDALTVLENWVERGQPPSVLIAQRLEDGAPERALPIYPYPLVPRYSGSGDPKRASSFAPFDPTKKWSSTSRPCRRSSLRHSCARSLATPAMRHARNHEQAIGVSQFGVFPIASSTLL